MGLPIQTDLEENKALLNFLGTFSEVGVHPLPLDSETISRFGPHSSETGKIAG